MKKNKIIITETTHNKHKYIKWREQLPKTVTQQQYYTRKIVRNMVYLLAKMNERDDKIAI